ncbi:hypothetical protein BT63DRAFT_457166 [Microthyrium microscopicum]|uniref:BZIP domain-containing protein n=1 Tax=Microthyrium microscopicum TaxID=703497 RepID=A0A6A6U889_9PEZI|nr:hypothetical protein BT63DRAFT_457166 [Microthyrium microscopicum]
MVQDSTAEYRSIPKRKSGNHFFDVGPRKRLSCVRCASFSTVGGFAKPPLVGHLNYSNAPGSFTSLLPTVFFPPSTTASHQQTWPSPQDPPVFHPSEQLQIPRTDFQLFDSARQVRAQQQRPAQGHNFVPTINTPSQLSLFPNSAPASSTGLNQLHQHQSRHQGQLFPSNSTTQLNQQRSPHQANMAGNSLLSSPAESQILTPTSDFELMTSFSSELTGDLDGGLFDPTSPLIDYDGFGGAELSAMPTNTSDLTVSPHELALNDSPSLYGSAPPSGALTNLTSPDIYNTSPDYSLDHLDAANWSSLFPDQPDTVAPVAMQRNFSSGSSISPSNSPHGVGAARTSERPTSIHRNSVGGVTKSRRRQGQLKIIDYDTNDKVAAKRARNTLAARDSRARKAAHVEHLEGEISKLEEELDQLRKERASCHCGASQSHGLH